jgi:hypothetical protein
MSFQNIYNVSSYTYVQQPLYHSDQKVRLWIEEKILSVVLARGGNLIGCNNIWDDIPPKIPKFSSFLEYENWAINEIYKFHRSGTIMDEEESLKIVTRIFPMFYTNRKDENNTIKKIYDELIDLLDNNKC